MSAILAPVGTLVRHRRLLAQTVGLEVRKRYVGSLIGLAWLALGPLLFLAVYSGVYLFIFRASAPAMPVGDYILLIFAGLIAFLGLAEALAAGVGSVVANASLIKNTLFPIELVPVRALFASQVTQVVGTGMLVAAAAAVKGLTPWVLLLPVVWVAQVAFMAGVLWVLSSLNVYLRDLQHLVGTLVLLLMLLSPISYTLAMVPETLRALIALNPLTHYIVCYQDVLVFGRAPDPASFALAVALGLGSFVLGFQFFRRLKSVFADNV